MKSKEQAPNINAHTESVELSKDKKWWGIRTNLYHKRRCSKKKSASPKRGNYKP